MVSSLVCTVFGDLVVPRSNEKLKLKQQRVRNNVLVTLDSPQRTAFTGNVLYIFLIIISDFPHSLRKVLFSYVC